MTHMIYVLIGILVLFFLYIGFSVFFYRRKLAQWKHIIIQYKDALEDMPTLDIQARISSAHELFALIDTLIEYEIISDREYEILLQKKSSKINFEDSVKKISESVFKSIEPSVFTDVNNVITSQCLMTYIQRRTFVEYFAYLQKNNESAG